MKKISVKIQNYEHRENLIIALASAGFKTKVDEWERKEDFGTDYYVDFELDDEFVEDIEEGE